MGNEEKNIYQRILAIQTEIKTIEKNLKVGKGEQQYKATGERDVIDAVKPLENKHGVYSYCYDREIVSTQETENKYHTVSYWQRFKCKYKFVNVDKPSEFIETVTFADGVDTLDKGSGKGMTYADKYALMKVYKISTGEDLDQYKLVEQTSENINNNSNNNLSNLVIEVKNLQDELKKYDVDVRSENIENWMKAKYNVTSELKIDDAQYLNFQILGYTKLLNGKKNEK